MWTVDIGLNSSVVKAPDRCCKVPGFNFVFHLLINLSLSPLYTTHAQYRSFLKIAVKYISYYFSIQAPSSITFPALGFWILLNFFFF
jgi:hypothetical protein